MEGRFIKATELSYKVGASIQTITMWYKFKEENPDNEYSQMLPDYVRIGAKKTRYWREGDIERLIEFRKRIPQGRNGVLGSVTQRYVGKKTMKNASCMRTVKAVNAKTDYVSETEGRLLENGVEPGTVKYVISILKEELSCRESLVKRG